MASVVSQIFGPEPSWPEQDLVALSDDLDPWLVLEAYKAGVFPMPLPHVTFTAKIGWWSPMARAVLLLDDLRVTRSLRQATRRYTVTIDTDFPAVLAGCADPSRPHGWIDSDIEAAYTGLFEAGHVHSVETRDADGVVVGGLYGVSIGGLFAGESMFHTARDASKVALVALVEFLQQAGGNRLLDVQWLTPHLESLGATEISRQEYLSVLDDALLLPTPAWPPRHVPRQAE